MRKILILILSFVVIALLAGRAEAKWWIFGQGNNEIGFDYLYLNNNSYDELGSKVVLYKDSLQDSKITIKGKTSIKKGSVGYIKITKDNKQTWEKVKFSDNGTFSYSFIPENTTKYQLYIETSDTTGFINKVDDTYKEITVVDENIRGKVSETLNNLIRSYENEESNLFMTYISPDFAGDTAILDSAIRKDFNTFDLIKINPYINNITTGNGGKVYAAIQFNRTVVASKTGQTFTDKGYTEFVMTNENGKFKVFSMKNPLIFGLSNAGEVATGTVQAINNDPILLVDNSGNVNEKPFKEAIDIIANNSDINSDSSDSSSSVETGTHSFIPPQSFEFSTETIAPHISHLDISYDYGGGPVAFGYHGTGKYNNLGACSLSSITSVPEYTDAGYVDSPFMPTVGNCYALLLGGFTPPYKYAVFKVTNLTMIEMFIEYKYQPDGTTNF